MAPSMLILSDGPMD